MTDREPEGAEQGRYRCDSAELRFDGNGIPVQFELEVSRFGDLSIRLDPFMFGPGESWGSTYELLERLHRGENRTIPFFELSGTTADGTRVHTSLASLTRFRHEASGETVRLHSEATACELDLSFSDRAESSDRNHQVVTYYTRSQQGLFPIQVHATLGKLSVAGARADENLEDRFGIVQIEGDDGAVGPGWVAEGEELAGRVLDLLSLGQGRRLRWTRRDVFRGKTLITSTLRPQVPSGAVRPSLFHPVHLNPILENLLPAYTPELMESTGLRVALSWMLAPSSSHIDLHHLHLMVALEHLVSVFTESRKKLVVDKKYFKTSIAPELIRALQGVAAGTPGSQEWLHTFRERILQINRPSFFDSVQALAAHYRVPTGDLTTRELKIALVDCRNDLVHRGLFASIREEDQLLRRTCDVAEEFMNRLVLAMLDYRGAYISALYDLESYVMGENEVRPLNLRPGTNKTNPPRP